MYRFKMRFLLVFCAGFAFATTNANAASTVRVLGKTTPATTLPAQQNIKSHTIDGSAATMRAATKNNSRVMTTNRIKTAAPSSARISTINIPKIVDVTDKPQINPRQNTVPAEITEITEILNNYYTKEEINEIINNNNYEQSDVDVVGQYGVTVDVDGNTYTAHLTGIDGSEDPNDIYVYRDGQFRKFEFQTSTNDFSGNVNACNEWESEEPCNTIINVNVNTSTDNNG